jgi:hypothetical protein
VQDTFYEGRISEIEELEMPAPQLFKICDIKSSIKVNKMRIWRGSPNNSYYNFGTYTHAEILRRVIENMKIQKVIFVDIDNMEFLKGSMTIKDTEIKLKFKYCSSFRYYDDYEKFNVKRITASKMDLYNLQNGITENIREIKLEFIEVKTIKMLEACNFTMTKSDKYFIFRRGKLV